MAFYLRDQYIKNVSIDIDALSQLSSIFAERLLQLQSIEASGTQQNPTSFLTYIIRFDNKGYRVFSLEELIRYFNLANEVERILFTVESSAALTSNRSSGSYLELCFDCREPSRCTLIASSDSKDWVEASFANVQSALTKFKTKNWIVRGPWTNLIIQMVGVVFGFLASLWLAFKVAPSAKIENSFVISFIFIFLLFSNIWGYANQAILQLIFKIFPNVDFIRPSKARLHWILQAIIGSAAFAAVVYSIGAASSFLVKILSDFF